MDPLLSVQNLETQFFTRLGVVRAANNVSFDVAPGETVGVVGESGCGKSVTSLSIMRLIPSPGGRIVAGKILFDGDNLLEYDEEEMRRIRGKEIAMVFQDPMTSLNPFLRIGRQMTEAMEQHLGLNGQAAWKRAIELLEMVGIPMAEARLRDYPHQFSGGMRQRVMIAMAISCNPRLLIADEPTSALDVTIQAQILELIKEIKEKLGTAVLVITHDMGVVAGMCQRILVMYGGEIVESGSVSDIFYRPQHQYTRGLLKSVPRIDETRKAKLDPIRGLPPDLVDPPDRCLFAPRCDFAKDQCWSRRAGLKCVGDGHWSTCWETQESGPL